MNRLFVTVEEVDAVIDTGYTVIRVYTDTSESGTFTTLDGTITLVASTDSYEYTDLDGTSATWYKTAYYGSGPGEGTKSSARRGESRAAYATVQEFRADVNMVSIGDDLTIARLLDAAARTINRFCNRREGFMADITASARYYPGSGSPIQWIDECVAVSAVAVKDSASDDEDDYTSWTVGTVGSTTSADVFPASGDPARPDYTNTPYTFLIIGSNASYAVFTTGQFITRGGFKPESSIARGVPTIKVTARWGYADIVPDDIRQACIMQAARWYKRLQSSMADTLAGSEMGTLMYHQSLDPDIRLMLESGRYVKPAVGRR